LLPLVKGELVSGNLLLERAPQIPGRGKLAKNPVEPTSIVQPK